MELKEFIPEALHPAKGRKKLKSTKRLERIFCMVCVICLILVLSAAIYALLRSPAGSEEEGETGESVTRPAEESGLTWALTEQGEEELPGEASMIFEESAEGFFPTEGLRLDQGKTCTLQGVIRANRPITKVAVSVTCARNNDGPLYPYEKTVRPDSSEKLLTLSLSETPVTDDGKTIADLVDFSAFTPGVHTLKITASCDGLRNQLLYKVKFYVCGPEWIKRTKSDFNGGYEATLKFFKNDTKRFMYDYQWVNGRYTMADPDWEEEYIVTMPGLPEGEEWTVHRDAVPYMQQAINYMNKTYIRVHGTNGDTGVILLKNLVFTYNGAYVSRFTSTLKTVSQHAFGTAIDLNSGLEPNGNTKENNTVVGNDVKKNLKYNGIITEGERSYYDFTYSGSYEDKVCGVPSTCVNYLLYELAFYRAGFVWGYYYKSTSDAMHFSLSENTYGSHDGKNSLKKVKAYAD